MGSMTARVALVLVLLIAGPARAAFNDIVTGARPQGMGGAFVAVADDANALYWNPAGLTQLDSAEATFMHSNDFDITVGPALNTDYVGFVNWPMEAGSFGFSILQQGNNKVLQERTISLSMAHDVSKHASFGLNVKYLELDPTGTQVNPADPALHQQGTFSFDQSGLFTITKYWRLGYLARNIGGSLGAAQIEELRTTYRVGSAYRFEDLLFESDGFTWALDLYTRNDVGDRPGVRVRCSTGVEYSIDERFSVRAGVNNGNFAAGLGLGHPESGIFIDYAFSNDDPGVTHRLSASYRFGGPPGEVHVVHKRKVEVHHHIHDEPPPEDPPPPPPQKRQVEGRAPALRDASPIAPPDPVMARGTWRTDDATLGAPPAPPPPPRKKAKPEDKDLAEFLDK